MAEFPSSQQAGQGAGEAEHGRELEAQPGGTQCRFGLASAFSGLVMR
jgi:hypothetical protein